jgi:CRP-like cAMP-binding protein
MTTALTDLPENRMLAAMTAAQRSELQPFVAPAILKQGHVLFESGDVVDRVYFPHKGMISLLAVMADGGGVETATVGSEGVVGAMAGLAAHITVARVVVQTPLIVSQIAAGPFREAAGKSAALRALIVTFNEALLAQIQTTAACNALHPIHERLARWLLQTSDRLQDEEMPLTQELLAEMLGVRRTSVSDVAVKLQQAGLIRYQRGSIQIIDRKGLEAASCECYAAIKNSTLRITS